MIFMIILKKIEYFHQQYLYKLKKQLKEEYKILDKMQKKRWNKINKGNKN